MFFILRSMNKAKSDYYDAAAKTIIKAMKNRNFEADYFHTGEEAVKAVLKELPEGAVVSWGGSVTLEELGLKEALINGPYKVINRDEAETPEEAEACYHRALNADFYFMSTNALTKDGRMVNIDGRGNRLSALIYGPKKVFVLAGMNKVAADLDAAFLRVRNLASPMNVRRLNKRTPCASAGFCSDCQSSDCICCQEVVTRRSAVKGRIHVILIGEELGF